MSALKEMRHNEYERQRRDFTGKRLTKHNDARDLVSEKKQNTDVQQTVVFMPFEGKLRTIKGKYPCSRSINTEVQSFAVGMNSVLRP